MAGPQEGTATQLPCQRALPASAVLVPVPAGPWQAGPQPQADIAL